MSHPFVVVRAVRKEKETLVAVSRRDQMPQEKGDLCGDGERHYSIWTPNCHEQQLRTRARIPCGSSGEIRG